MNRRLRIIYHSLSGLAFHVTKGVSILLCILSTFPLITMKWEDVAEPLVVICGLMVAFSALCFSFGAKSESEDAETAATVRYAGELLFGATITFALTLGLRFLSETSGNHYEWAQWMGLGYRFLAAVTVLFAMAKTLRGFLAVSEVLRKRQAARWGLEGSGQPAIKQHTQV